MIEDSLEQLGFTKNEARLYLAVAEAGKANAQLIAKKVGLPRTTAYSVLDSLLKKGVVTTEQKKSTTF